MTLLGILFGIALILTHAMFTSKQPVLGFACAMFWMIAGGQAYTLSVIPWGDIYFYLFFAASFGMTIFTALAAFGLREKRDTLADEEMEEGDEGGYIGEGKDKLDPLFEIEDEAKPSRRVQALRDRAKQRRGKD